MMDWTYKKGDSFGNQVGVVVEDEDQKIYDEIRQALRERKILYMQGLEHGCIEKEDAPDPEYQRAAFNHPGGWT